MVTQRSALWEATHTGLFASVYWAVWGIAVGLAVAAFAWGTTEHRMVTGYIVMGVVVAQIVASRLVARRIQRRRDAERGGDTERGRSSG
ncbi:hypothetical protein [Conyzicola sp.]|uniref:hypothetical protein n=1 Tax=Conyzicola sp. TaxID=1969404 RepID=UPI003989C5A5